MNKLKTLYAIIVMLCCSCAVQGQSYRWIKGGGSTEAMTPSRNYEQVKYMCTDENGNVYAASIVGKSNILADTFYKALAYNTSASIPHILVTSYRCDGTMRWAKLIESAVSGLAGGISYHDGSIYMVCGLNGANKHIGYDTVFSTSNLCSFTLRLDTTGHLKWIRGIGPDIATTAAKTGDKGALAIDGNGYIHNFNCIRAGCQVTGAYTTPVNGTYDLKYDTAGNLLSVNQIAVLDSVWMITKAIYNPVNNKFYAITQPNSNYWYLVYSDWNTAVCAFQYDGTLIWRDTTGLSGTAEKLDYVGGNEIYVAGAGQYPGGYSLGGVYAENAVYGSSYAYATIFKMDTNGVSNWVYNLQGNSGVNAFLDVVILPSSKIASVGFFTGTPIHGTDTIRSTTGEVINPLFAIIDSSGHTVKLDQLHGPGSDDLGKVVTSDNVGNIYLGGELSSTMAATGLTAYATNGGNTDFFVAKYGYDCSCTTPPTASYTSSGSTTISFNYTGTTSYDSLRWYFGDGGTSTSATPTHTYATSGTFHACVTVYTSCGSDTHCEDFIVCIPPVASFTDTGTRTVGCTYTGSMAGVDSVRWYFGDGGTSTATNPIYTYAASGTYTICVVAYSACGNDTACSTVHIDISGNTAVMPLLGADVQVYPNPVTDKLVITGAFAGSVIKVVDILGRVVRRGVATDSRMELDMNGIAHGHYVVQLYDSRGCYMIKTVLKE